MSLFAGLYAYEIVLMLMGVALFLALLIALLRNVFKDKPFAALIPAFFIPIVMIGYPSIESVQYQNGIIDIQKTTDQIQADPSNPQAQAELQDLETKVDKEAPRAMNDPNASRVLDQARLVLAHPPAKTAKSGDTEKGKTAPESSNNAALITEAEELTKSLSAEPKNTEVRERLTKVIEEIKSKGATDSNSVAVIARAEKALGHTVN